MNLKARCEWITAKRIHFTLAVFWLVMSIPSVLFWRNSVPFLVFISVYALAAAHASAYAGSKAEEAATESGPN